MWIFQKFPAPEKPILTREEILTSLHKLCIPSNTSWRSDRCRISDKNVQSIETYLGALDARSGRQDDRRWKLRPRIYGILENIGATELMDNFIQDNLTDFNLPFNEQTLPLFLGERAGRNLRNDFFDIQDYYFTEVKDIESEKSDHQTLSVTGDTYYRPERPLGHGSFGEVDQVFSCISTKRFARKRVLRGRGSEQSQQCLIKELQELRRLSHRHLVQIVGSYTDTECIAFLMEPVADGTLEEFLSGPLIYQDKDKIVLRRLYGCLAGAMNYLHTHQVRHRDLTARNILLDSTGEVYISDFGSAYNWASKPSSKTRHRNTPTSPDYMAPEVAKEDERGTSSDMWSLGVVFLEITTKLLNHSVAELKRKIQSDANKTRAPAYPYANMTTVTNWMKMLGETDTEHNYDREPLSWVRELLHVKHQHRPTSPQLMTYIRESPSFGLFRCIRCEEDFRNEVLTSGPAAPMTKSKEQSRQTREEIKAIFDEHTSKESGTRMSLARTDSIKQWLAYSNQSEALTVEIPDSKSPNDARDVDEVHGPDTTSSGRPLYNPNDPNRPMTGYNPWTQEFSGRGKVKSKPDIERKDLTDSGLGFMEYMSNSSEDVEIQQPFEERSDYSSTHSDESSHIQNLNDSFDTLFKEDELIENSRNSCIGRRESSELLFDEEEDRSEVEAPWDEVSDRSDITAETSKAEDTNTKKSEIADPLPKQAPVLTNASSGIKSEPVPLNDGSKGFETGEYREPQTQDKRGSLPYIEEQPGSSSPRTDDTNQEKEKAKAKVPPELLPNSLVEKKHRRRARVSEPVEYSEQARPNSGNNDDQRMVVPDILIDFADASQPEPLRMSESNMRRMNNKTRSPITPRERNAFVPVDVRRLMDNTWGMASSAVSTTVSKDTKSRIDRFIFMIPTDAQIEGALSACCKKGSSGAVKQILNKISSGNKPLKYRQWFSPLIYAVRGASTRHNKCVRELLAAGVDPNHHSRKTGLTPLHVAVGHPNFKGYANLIWLLLSNKIKADPNARDQSGELPLTKLFVGADTTPLEPHKRGALIMLLKEGANPKFRLPGTGNTPLHLAVRRQDRVAVAMLLYMGADVDAKSTSGTTPLQLTANQFRGELSMDHAEVLEHLLQHGAHVDETAGVLGRTALHWAVIAGCAQAVARLLEAGANPRLLDNEDSDAVALAIQHAENLTSDSNREKLADHVEIMLGLAKAANFECMLEKGRCAIETACRREDGELLEALLTSGLSPNSRFRRGTILEFARRRGGDVAKGLLESKLGALDFD